MKNTVKKILALVFVVAMVCSLAVPAFAEEKINVIVSVVDYDGNSVQITVPVDAEEATVRNALNVYNDEDNAIAVGFARSTGKVSKVAGVEADEVMYVPNDETEEVEGNVFGTGYWAVAVNGKLVSEDLSTVAIEEGDRIVVYWNDPTFGTKLAQVDDSAIAQGIISFYYYDAEGNKKPLTGADVVVRTQFYDDGEWSGAVAANKEKQWYKVRNEMVVTDDEADTIKEMYSTVFTTDELGQIWISPRFLDDDTTLYIDSVEIDPLAKLTKDQKKAYKSYEIAYRDDDENRARNLENVDVIGVKTEITDLYDVAGATGDMTIVYVMVAAAAVVTLGAVVIMKKKAVKAN